MLSFFRLYGFLESSVQIFNVCQTVAAAWKEPYAGWIEGMGGPTGLMVAGARGN